MHKIEIPQSILDRVLKRRPSLHYLDTLVGPRTAHIVVDLQNGFMAPGQPAEIPTAREIVPNVNRISAALRPVGGLNVFIQNTIDAEAHKTWSNWFKRVGPTRAPRMNEAFAFGSFGQMVIVALFGVIGFVVARVLDGELDLGAYLPRRRDPR